MKKPNSTSGCGCADVYNTVFIDTSLDTHLAVIVSNSDTVSDLKKKIMYEHPLCFPNIANIKINSLKVECQGIFYHLSDSMFVKSAFVGVSENWFLLVDVAKEHRENDYPGIKNHSAYVFDPLAGDMIKRLSNINDASLPQDRDNYCAKQNSPSQQFGFSNSTKENSEDLHNEVEHMADSNSQVSFPATNKGPRLIAQLKDVGENICEDLPASADASILKEKQKTKKIKKDNLKENDAIVVESGKDALDSGNVLEENSFKDGPSSVLNDANMGNQISNIESVKQNHFSPADASGGKKIRKRQKLNPSQAGSEVSSAKDVHHVHLDTFQAVEAKDKDSDNIADLDSFIGKRSMGGVISEPCPISPMEMQEVSETNRVPHSEGDNEMDDTNDGNLESKNEAPQPVIASVIKTRNYQNSSHVDGHPTSVSREGINFRKAFGASGDENQSDTLEEKIVEPKKSSKKVKKSKKSKGPVGGTEAVDVVRNRGPASEISPAEESPTTVNSEHLSDNVEQAGKSDGKEESKMKKSDCSPLVNDVKADKSRKKNKKKSSPVLTPPELQAKDDVDQREPTFLVHNVTEVSTSSKSTRKTVNADSSLDVQLNGSDFGSNRNKVEPQHDGRPIQDDASVDHSKSILVDNVYNSKEVPGGSKIAKSQQKHGTVDSGEVIIDKVTHKAGVETAVKGKRKKNPKPELPSLEMLNGNQHKEAKTQATKASSSQSQISLSKVEPSSSNVKPSKQLLAISESAAEEPPQSKKSGKIDATPKTAQKSIEVNSSRVHTGLKKNNHRAVSSSAFEKPKWTINLKKGGNEPQSQLDVAKATGTNSRIDATSLANKKSLLATVGTIFRHDDNESSDDEDGVGNSDSSTRAPSNSSSSSDYSSNSIAKGSASQNGSYDSEGEESGGRKKQKPGSSSPKSISLHAILRNSSSYKKAKLTASQDIDSQPEEFVPDSLAP
ncbi:3-ketoacyl-CoA reductase 1 isoform 1 [Hibiscus syriacus]|uniref:3-ketoacyl-CoA reductase 1 isoform 1 n=1 Tax=Hibiscus syriacus TaxID=106335 RepID=A0A6A3CL78_HIBSY|nr:neurofilament heavy polypeptide-like [Hibiscus syriacus]KAE8730165.1 3-ketoacyl-CoA reductase 1 isoform 1 [Hibiscus syriacus]